MEREKTAKWAWDKQVLEQLRARQWRASDEEALSPSEPDEDDDDDEETREVLSSARAHSSEEDDDELTLSQCLGSHLQISPQSQEVASHGRSEVAARTGRLGSSQA